MKDIIMESTDKFIASLDKKEKARKDNDIREAKNELIMCNAVANLLQDNDLACEVTINGITIGLCSNLSVLPAIKKNITEINKFLKGEPNEWE